mgnify:CR=1 FL=1
MTKTNVLATKETVKALESMDFVPIKVLEALGYNYTEKSDCVGRNEEWSEHRYTGVNPEDPEDIAVVTVGERDGEQYIYLENEDGEDWRGLTERHCMSISTRDRASTLSGEPTYIIMADRRYATSL